MISRIMIFCGLLDYFIVLYYLVDYDILWIIGLWYFVDYWIMIFCGLWYLVDYDI